ncbi:MAG TPA: hypothetical protein VK509_06030 [Polyangiales bacterium]|nr:hypothetical protein [Polyangiales bacterium]
MKGFFVQLLKVVATAVVSAPLAVMLTWMLLPFWDWLEASTGLESRGHSGPSGWCYLAVYGVLLVASLSLLFWPRSRAQGEHSPS